MRLRLGSLAARLLLLALAQVVLLSAAAVLIFFLTVHGGHHDRHVSAHEQLLRRIGPVLTLGAGVLVLVVGALVTARWIVRPIERLSRSARAIGAGDLSVRTGLDRDDELGALGRQFDRMAEQLAAMRANERELLANVAHELRTPLSRIGVALDLAGEGDVKRVRSSLNEIAVDAAELEVIVDDVLIALRFDTTPSATLPLRRQRTAPAQVAAAAAERLRTRHPERPLELSLGSDLPEVHVDPMMLRRVIDNLLENSHKYTPEPSAPIGLTVSAAAGTVVFEVVDRGIGIASADLPNVYNAFFRAERSRARETGGTGLGLTLARRIVEAHEGTIELTSTPGAGTRARVVIPADRP